MAIPVQTYTAQKEQKMDLTVTYPISPQGSKQKVLDRRPARVCGQGWEEDSAKGGPKWRPGVWKRSLPGVMAAGRRALEMRRTGTGAPWEPAEALGKTVCVSTQTHANRDHCLQLQAPANYALGFQAEQVRAAKC